jgi:hypothetical protein
VAKTDEKAYAAVEEELRRNPGAGQDELWEKAKEASPGVAKLSRREFNARYPLQIKRKILRESGGGDRKRAPGAKRAAGKKGGRRRGGGAAVAAAAAEAADATAPVRRRPGRPKGSGRKAAAAASAAPMASPDREGIRQVLLNFATDVVSAADQPKNLVRVLAGVDRYVDRVVKARS